MKRHLELYIKNEYIDFFIECIISFGGDFVDKENLFFGLIKKEKVDGSIEYWISYEKIPSNNSDILCIYFTVFRGEKSIESMLKILLLISSKIEDIVVEASYDLIFPLNEIDKNRHRFIFEEYEDFRYCILSQNRISNLDLISFFSDPLIKEKEFNKFDFKGLNLYNGILNSFNYSYDFEVKSVFKNELLTNLVHLNKLEPNLLFESTNYFQLFNNDIKTLADNMIFDFY